MAKEFNFYNFITSTHELYERYIDDWNLATKSYYGGVEYRNGQYLKRYDIDDVTPSEVINTYDIDEYGNQTGKYSSRVVNVNSKSEAESGTQYLSSFYQEKLQNVPVYPYTRLYVSEYNAILFQSPPVRLLPEDTSIMDFIQDVDGEGNSINEFMSAVDIYSTVNGVVWVSCLKPAEGELPRWRMHLPQDVTNWQYRYSTSGDLELDKIVIEIADTEEVTILQYFTPDMIKTVFIQKDEDKEIEVPEEAVYYENEELGYYVIENENELGYIPVVPIYQSNKIYNGVGHTPMFDIAGIQRSIYADSAEIYSSITYGAHPVTLTDEETANMNDGALGAEPGTIIRVPAGISGESNYVFEFRAPPLDSISELRELINQKIEKMNVVAMIRTDELIKAARSGAQLEQYDSKLEAFIRKKATSLENNEVKLWEIFMDWMGRDMPADLSISYNRLYSKKGLEQEVNEINQIMGLLDQYTSRYMSGAQTFVAKEFATREEAEAESQRLGGSGSHSHTDLEGNTIYMPFNTHAELEAKLEQANPGVDFEEDTGFTKEMKEKLRDRMRQLIESSYSENSL